MLLVRTGVSQEKREVESAVKANNMEGLEEKDETSGNHEAPPSKKLKKTGEAEVSTAESKGGDPDSQLPPAEVVAAGVVPEVEETRTHPQQ